MPAKGSATGLDRAAEERIRIREALLDLCFERGYANLELDDLLTRAKLPAEGFERHYADLEDCFAQIYRAEYDACWSQAERARQGLDRWRDRLRVTGYVLYRFLGREPRLTHFFIIEVMNAGPRPRAVLEEGIRAMSSILDEGRLEAPDPSGLTMATAESVGGGIFFHLFAAAHDGPLPPEAETVPEIMHAAVLPYLGPAAAEEELHIPPPEIPLA